MKEKLDDGSDVCCGENHVVGLFVFNSNTSRAVIYLISILLITEVKY